MPDFDHMNLSDIADALRKGTTTAQEILAWTDENYSAHEPRFNAFKTRDTKLPQLEARAADAAFLAHLDLGPLQGLPISIKDMVGVRGYPTFAGCSFPLPEAYESEGPVVSRLRHQLGVVVGKTHTVQFAYGGLGANHNWGAPRNPWDKEHHRSPGGSSSGAGVSVVTGMALAAIGTDTAGSVRIPASATGICGLRPTKGRWSAEGIVPLSPPFDTAGPLARNVSDLSFVFSALDPDGKLATSETSADLSGLRVGIVPFLFADCDDGIAEVTQQALGELERAGARLVELDIPQFEAATSIFSKGGLHIGEFTSFIRHEAQEYFEDLDPIVKIRLENMPECSAADHLFRARRLKLLAHAMNEYWRTVDVIAGPTLPITPPKMEDVKDPIVHLAANMKLVRNTNLASLLGLCALTMPVGLDACAMPVGLQIMAPPMFDRELIRLAMKVEETIGTSLQRLGSAPDCHILRNGPLYI